MNSKIILIKKQFNQKDIFKNKTEKSPTPKMPKMKNAHIFANFIYFALQISELMFFHFTAGKK